MKKILTALFFTVIGLGIQAQCISGMYDESEMEPNPENDINGTFKFDYKIISKFEGKFQYIDAGRTYYKTVSYDMDYYVNTSDNSMFFPKGFFMSSVGRTSDRRGNKIDGAVSMPTGQMVSYVQDAMGGDGATPVKRAMMVQTNNSAFRVATEKVIASYDFAEGIEDITGVTDSLPSPREWTGITEILQSNFTDARGTKIKATVHFDARRTRDSIKTTLASTGFLVGIIRDSWDRMCKRLAVFVKMEMVDTNEYMQVELISIEPVEFTFDASPYKPAILGGQAGTDIRRKMASFRAQMLALATQKKELENRRRRCGPRNSACWDDIDRQLEGVKTQMTNLECRMARAMGLEDKMECP